MPDLAYIAVIVAFFAVCGAYVGGCARIVGRDAAAEDTADLSTEAGIAPEAGDS